ncbi:MAG: carboxylating nicotinate-nucleotide diphosphorylase [Firmicutes bacterium]|nr:carboxylating nicotinate-nucleotide diphosphorylase [Bacillota bacterium]
MKEYLFKNIIIDAIIEDIGSGDITTNICISEDSDSEALLIAKDSGILSGIEVFEEVFNILDSNVNIEFNYKEGDNVEKGDIIAMIWGKTKSILSGERVALNFLQHLSGIATSTRKYVDMVDGFSVKIVDTRKTTPLLRVLEKYAVTIGGGYNHRFGLYDGIMIKDNHIVGAGSIKNAIELAKKNSPHTLKIEVETSNNEEVKEALENGADIIMLDNMSIEEMKVAVDLINGKAIVEASGNMADRDLKDIAATGVNIISIGGLTNSIKALDISLKFK